MPLFSEAKQKEFVRRFDQGKNKSYARLHASEKDSEKTKKTLAGALKKRSDFVDDLEEMLGATDTGKEVLSFLYEQDTNIIFSVKDGFSAAYQPDKGVICLNYENEYENARNGREHYQKVDCKGMYVEDIVVPRLLTAVGHEAYHQLQTVTKKEKTDITPGHFSKYELLSSMGERFSSEAGADAFAALLVISCEEHAEKLKGERKPLEEASSQGKDGDEKLKDLNHKIKMYSLVGDLFRADPKTERVYNAVKEELQAQKTSLNETDTRPSKRDKEQEAKAFRKGVHAWKSRMYAAAHMDGFNGNSKKEILPEDLIVGNFPTFSGENYFDGADKSGVAKKLLTNQVAAMLEVGAEYVEARKAQLSEDITIAQAAKAEVKNKHVSKEINGSVYRKQNNHYLHKIERDEAAKKKYEQKAKPIEKARMKLIELKSNTEKQQQQGGIWERLKNTFSKGDRLAPNSKGEKIVTKQLADAAIEYVKAGDQIDQTEKTSLKQAEFTPENIDTENKELQNIEAVKASALSPEQILHLKKGIDSRLS